MRTLDICILSKYTIPHKHIFYNRIMDNFELKNTAVYNSINYKKRIYGLKTKTATKGVVCLGCGLWEEA